MTHQIDRLTESRLLKLFPDRKYPSSSMLRAELGSGAPTIKTVSRVGGTLMTRSLAEFEVDSLDSVGVPTQQRFLESILHSFRVLETGKCSYYDPSIDLFYELEYKTNPVLFPSLDGDRCWDRSGCDPLEDLFALAENYYFANHEYAPCVIMRTKNFAEIRRARSTKREYLHSQGLDEGSVADVNSLFVSSDFVKDYVLERTRAKELLFVDDLFYSQMPDGGINSLSFVSEDSVILASDNVVQRAVVMGFRSNAPIFIPACFDTDKLCSMRVN